MISKKTIKTILLNVGIFILVFVLQILRYWTVKDDFGEETEFFRSRFDFTVYIMGIIWINHFFLVRYLFDRKKYVFYGMSLFVVIVPLSVWLSQGRGLEKILAISTFFLYTTGIGMAAFFLRRTLVISREITEKENLQRQMELKYLKNQVNPHFLFNALNSIYSLAKKSSPETPEVVMQLSELLRYQMEAAEKNKVFLREELNFIENYLLLAEQRLGQKCTIEFNIEGELSRQEISPMLLIPFVENAVKHGAQGTNEKSHIEVGANVIDSTLHLHVKNSKPQTQSLSNGRGTGLENVKRRLHLLYPAQHALEIVEEAQYYQIDLKLKLENN